MLKALPMKQLKSLALRHGIRLHSKVNEGMFYREVKRPGKLQYVTALAKVVSLRQVQTELRKIS
jgi:hypothetical protein